jgi:hypothetical protein
MIQPKGAQGAPGLAAFARPGDSQTPHAPLTQTRLSHCYISLMPQPLHRFYGAEEPSASLGISG